MATSVRVSRILHAGYVLECEGTQIAFDPIFENPFSGNCHAFPDVRFDPEQIKKLKFSAVLISHYHDDHCSLESLNLLDRETPIYIYCLYEELLDMIRELGFQKVFHLEIGKTVHVGPFDIRPWRALDEDVDSIFQIQAAGFNVLNVVDSWIDPETLEQLASEKPWDLILWPFQTMRELEVLAPSKATAATDGIPYEWTEQLQRLNPRFLVPSSCQFQMESWSWYNHFFFPISYRQFEKEIGQILPKSQIVRMNPGVSFELGAGALVPSPRLSWVEPIGEQNLDYEFIENFEPTPTNEIAKHFEALTEGQTERVLKFCRQDIIEKYNSLEPPIDEYFEQPRIWQLSIFDHKGERTLFRYRLKANHMESIGDDPTPVDGSTEVPMAKLHAALEQGESLTSMYLRVVDPKFEDVIEDPLIRCLFTGVFGAYQAAQLKRILEAQGQK